jgi:hypothetical protein
LAQDAFGSAEVTEAIVLETTIRAYAAAWVARDREAWLRTFAGDATQEDPVGDPVREAAMVWTINGVTDDGAVSFDGVDVFQFDDAGRISSVRAFWHRGSLQRQFQRLRDADSGHR